MTSEEMAALVLTSLLRQGHHAGTLECLTHGDGRGTVPPNTLVNALAPIAAQLAEARQAERAAVVGWLRGSITQGAKMPGTIARHIEAGEHLK